MKKKDFWVNLVPENSLKSKKSFSCRQTFHEKPYSQVLEFHGKLFNRASP